MDGSAKPLLDRMVVLEWLQWSPQPQLLDVVWCSTVVVVVVVYCSGAVVVVFCSECSVAVVLVVVAVLAVVWCGCTVAVEQLV